MLMSKPLHLIIDGPDRVGKSTVCELLSRKLKLPVIKMKDMPKYFVKNPEEASEVFNKTVAQFFDYSFIQDRGYPSSMVYSKVFQRKVALDYIKEIQDTLKYTVIILYRAEPRAVDDIIQEKDHQKIKDMYLSIGVTLGWKLLDVGDLSPKEICKLILQKINL